MKPFSNYSTTILTLSISKVAAADEVDVYYEKRSESWEVSLIVDDCWLQVFRSIRVDIVAVCPLQSGHTDRYSQIASW